MAHAEEAAVRPVPPSISSLVKKHMASIRKPRGKVPLARSMDLSEGWRNFSQSLQVEEYLLNVLTTQLLDFSDNSMVFSQLFYFNDNDLCWSVSLC